jgi:DNA-binding protein H-NS
MIEHMDKPALDPIVEQVQQAHEAVLQATNQRDNALAERKAAIKALCEGGMSLTQIAALLGLSRARVSLIMNDNKVLAPGSRKKKKPRAAPAPRLVSSLGEWDGIL